MPIEQIKLEELIKNKFPSANIRVEDLAGDNNHYSVSIESSAFNGLSRIQQHQLVYDALGGGMGEALHALALQTSVPDDA